MINNVKKYMSFAIRRVFEDEINKKIILGAKNLSIRNNKIKKIKNLSQVEFQVYSQWGEDGIIDWLTGKLKKIPKIFLEIGTEDYKEANTRFLLVNNNWDGYLIEADKLKIKKIKKQRIYWKHNLKVKSKFINRENINNIITEMNIPKKIGLLSLDIDGVDYWILEKLSILDPVIIICEYNSLFGLKKSVTVPYKKNFVRSKEHYSHLYYGGSIKAFVDLMKKKNYFFIGTNSAGNNAFFIKNSFKKIVSKIIHEKKIFISKFRESRNSKGKLTFLNKKKSLKLIQDKFLIDLKDGAKRKIIELDLLN